MNINHRDTAGTEKAQGIEIRESKFKISNSES
jgi:hypothetical protein